MLLYIKNLKYKILRTLRNSSNEEPGSLIAAKFGLWFCDWATCVGQHMGYHAQKKQALFSLKLFHFYLHGCWHFWFQSGTFSDDFDVPLERFSIVLSRSVLFSLQLFVLQSCCTLKIYINILGAYLLLYPWILLAYWKWFLSRST